MLGMTALKIASNTRSKKKPGTYSSKNTAVIPNIFSGPPDPTFFSYFLEPKKMGSGGPEKMLRMTALTNASNTPL